MAGQDESAPDQSNRRCQKTHRAENLKYAKLRIPSMKQTFPPPAVQNLVHHNKDDKKHAGPFMGSPADQMVRHKQEQKHRHDHIHADFKFHPAIHKNRPFSTMNQINCPLFLYDNRFSL